MGVFLKVEGEFLTIVSGIDSRYLVAVMTVILLLELIYTVLGGMVSIVITDFIQYVLLSIATILVSLYAVYHAGWGQIVNKVTATMGEGGFNPFINPKFGLTFLLWQIHILVNRLANLFVSLFLMFWGLYYTPPGAVYLYLNITGTIFLAGAFVCVVGGLYWRRANTTGGYLAMGLGAAGAIIPYFFYTGEKT